ncbi:MAG: type II secretion system protein GspD [Candidatus Riflebacteria bacterium]|nr:type II secretion system protein GspD [Candidatus Riflebacteria bacterium]
MKFIWPMPRTHRLAGLVVLVLATLIGAAWAQDGAPTIELVLQDTPLESALKLVADQAGKKFEAHVPLDESVNVNIHGASLEFAVNKLLEGKPYMWALDGNSIHIFKGTAQSAAPVLLATMSPVLAPPVEKPPVTRIFTLKKRKVESVTGLLAKLITRDVSIVADVPTNSLVMIGTEKSIEAVASLAQEIDGTLVTAEVIIPEELISESFTLEYVTEFGDIEKNLCDILYGEHNQSEAASEVQSQLTASTLLNKPAQQEPGPRKEFFLLDKIRRILMITTNRAKMEMIREYFKRINTPIAQVLIEAHIVALEDGTDKNLGISWNVQDQWGAVLKDPNRAGATTNTGNTGAQIGGGFLFGRWDLSNVTGALRAVENQNKGQILSQPRLMTISGKTATIDISTKYPYKSSVTLNQTGTTQNVQFIDVGIILNVTPQVNTLADTVVMQLDPTVSDLVSMTDNGPITTQRRTSTNVEVKNGETVVIGGLLRDENVRSNKNVPVLSDIPVIGDFFKFSSKQKKRTNLMILITPHIVPIQSRINNRHVAASPGREAPSAETLLPSTSKNAATVNQELPENTTNSTTNSTAPQGGVIESYQQRLQKLKNKYLK